MKIPFKIYLASSWKNERQPSVIQALRADGFEVYDFREPVAGEVGFSWSKIDPNWKRWSWAEYVECLKNPIAAAAFKLDRDALDQCDACVLVLPAGNSSHLELGYAAGKGKTTIVLVDPDAPTQADLMYLLGNAVDGARFVFSMSELLAALRAEQKRKWFRLPIAMRQKWWNETDYGKRAPSPELLAAIDGASSREQKRSAAVEHTAELAREEFEKATRLIEAGYSDLLEKVVDGEIDVDTAMQIFDGRRP